MSTAKKPKLTYEQKQVEKLNLQIARLEDASGEAQREARAKLESKIDEACRKVAAKFQAKIDVLEKQIGALTGK